MKSSIGFTGTRLPLPSTQQIALVVVLADIIAEWLVTGLHGPRYFHHGDCVGSDFYAARVMHEMKVTTEPRIKIVAHPTNIPHLRGFSPYNDVIRDVKDPIVRNHDIVDESTILVATPGTMEEIARSGSWSTIRYARSLNREIRIIYPDGHQEVENGP